MPPRSQSPDTESSRIRVIVRLRPPVQEDYENDLCEPFKNIVRINQDRSSVTLLSPTGVSEREFRFDSVFDSSADQEDVYVASSSEVVMSALNGYNGAILAYGQTGTGKTFTIFGPGSDWERPEERKTRKPAPDEPSPFSQCGIVPRAILQLFDYIEEHSENVEFRVNVSFLQIYMEVVMDLLDQTKVNLPVREDPKSGIFVDGITQVQVDSPAQVLDYIREGAANRAISSTAMNKTSSRSHVILQLTVEQRRRESNCVKRGVLNIIDLAGSERVAKTGSEGYRLEEAKKINKSLSALGNVVAALSSNSPSTHVPFRDSKLTRLLSEFLGGNAKTCLCVCVGPAAFNYEETYSSLHFATRAMSVKNHAIVNEVADFRDVKSSLEQKILEYQSTNKMLEMQNSTLEKEVMDLKTTVASLQNRDQNDDVIGQKDDEDEQKVTLPNLSQPLQTHSIPPSFASSPTESVSERLTLLTTPPHSRLRRVSNLTSSPPVHSPMYSSARPFEDSLKPRGNSWDERERELTLHYTKIINDLQEKLERYQWLAGTHSGRYADGKESSFVLGKMVDFLMGEDAFRRRILEKIEKDF
ncbi:hypothetical protein P9112_011637 [Eukaryota sp. TZLM1-RC]